MNRKYIVYTAGEMAITVKKYAEALGMKVIAFYDNNINIQGKEVEGVKVLSFEELKKFMYSKEVGGIIIGSKTYESELLKEIEQNFADEEMNIYFQRILNKRECE